MLTRYASIVSTLALFVALGGTAAAVTQIPRDSVGAPQIRKDAVRAPEIAKDAIRSPEIAKDAVRSPEIAAGAVRSSELRDGNIQLADISTSAQHALTGARGPAGVAEALVASDPNADVPGCTQANFSGCQSLLTRSVGTGSWVVEAKLDIAGNGSEVSFGRCGLVQGTTVLDSVLFHLDAFHSAPDMEAIALSGVVKDVTAAATVGLRCDEESGQNLEAQNLKITALQATTVIGP